jgi:hypothetical protein
MENDESWLATCLVKLATGFQREAFQIILWILTLNIEFDKKPKFRSMYKIHRGIRDKIPNQTKIKNCCASKTCKTQSRFNVSNDSNGQVHGEIGCSDRLARRRFVHWAHIHSVNDKLGCTSVPFSVSNSDSNQGTLTTSDLDVFFFFMARWCRMHTKSMQIRIKNVWTKPLDVYVSEMINVGEFWEYQLSKAHFHL